MGLINNTLHSPYNIEEDPITSPSIKPTKCTQCHKSLIPSKFLTSSILLCLQCYYNKKAIRYQNDLTMTTILQIDCITDRIYLGNNEGAKAKDELKRLNISHILICGYYLHEYYPNDFTYKTVEIEDNDKENLINALLPCIEFIEGSYKVFVHCRAGKSRSSSVVIAYLMYENRWSYDEARKLVEKIRSEIEPNGNFVRQLREFENILVMCDYKMKQLKEFIKGFARMA